jgi:integrase
MVKLYLPRAFGSEVTQGAARTESALHDGVHKERHRPQRDARSGCGVLFRTIARGRGGLTATPLPQANAYAMICRRAAGAGIETKIGNHTFRATGITAYLKNGGALETAAAMANHSSTRTTQLYDRRSDQVSLDEIERVRI